MGEVDSSTILSIPPSDQNQVCAARWGSAGVSALTLSTGVSSEHSCLSDAFLPFLISQSLWRASMGGSLGLEGMVCPRAWRAMMQVSKQPLLWDLGVVKQKWALPSPPGHHPGLSCPWGYS